MPDNTISQVLNLLPALLALTFGARIGYVLANRGTARDIEMIDRHFESTLALAKQQYEMQFKADQRMRIREELKSSYDRLAMWLRELERTFDEINAGALSSNETTRAKASAIMDASPWEIVNTPADMASCNFYWSTETRTTLRKFLGPYCKFIYRAKSAMARIANSDSDHAPFDADLHESHEELIYIINEVRNQMRSDLENLK
ncbi:hypothetical protein [Streptomyces malaysiensis]|uniref:hypothetical protein n=1 Tax=Streptomyces malaysiensis TaxID=92644 RepID=UPI002B2C2101|nr:hypothetical protein R8789_25000 [Streptomyces malaysiensis]